MKNGRISLDLSTFIVSVLYRLYDYNILVEVIKQHSQVLEIIYNLFE